ncbi:CPBP family intramembrane glutamic endopeptidase [Candidatus Enterococcus lemimoniae]|uniref:CAAX prenyl protease 2/Lysostaphin resistance protein A-like domain-containing protein n=1 Tax=Candidatus Enterococcus lemimoniae TaxID=1834167 RepID=A0ABZ2T8I3_9ENTE|nr:CPBP family intramembrane glutamic endopeptidase [Enterococcus sp. 12C11_DIV0727]OTO70414.1 hypothetical protein A5866_002636 [Enterococcus sp. 12C11_DIV0727]
MLKFIYLLIYFLATKIIPAMGTSWNSFDPNFMIIQKIFFVLLSILFFKNELIESFKKIELKKTMSTVLIALTLLLLTYVIMATLLDTTLNFAAYSWTISFFLESILFAPFIEEIVYRYCFLSSNHSYVKLGMMLISSLLFAFSHAAAASYSLILLIPFLVLGLILSTIYIIKNNIWYSIFTHFFCNLIIFVMPLIISS